MGILSLFRNLRRKAGPARSGFAAGDAGGPTRGLEQHAAAPEIPSPPAPAGVEKSATPAFANLAEHSVLVRPVITEKATLLAAQGRYAFRVTSEATKTDVQRVVENLFGVHVTHVRLITLPSKLRRRGRIVGSVPGSRKALVTLRDGERIDLSAAVPFEKEQSAASSSNRRAPATPELTG
ncbi:MAG: large subunit ribosomal protein L23 [Parcubacteria group bacterium Gr01-1014_38]|nr:MAG: large subunit ribosomal protein L23 [Parcubacteria group bacterium Gr01-1014_38]